MFTEMAISLISQREHFKSVVVLFVEMSWHGRTECDITFMSEGREFHCSAA